MVRQSLVAMATGLVVLLVLVCPALADASTTGDLIPDATYPWTLDGQRSGPLTATDLWGAKGASVKGFLDAYRKVWSQPDQGMSEHLEHFSSVFWAAYHFGGAQALEAKSKSHSSFRKVSGYGSGAYEVTFAPNADGISQDLFVFDQFDYVATIAVGSAGSPDHAALMAQARAQLTAIPEPVGEEQTINGFIGSSALIAIGVTLGLALIIGVVLLVLVRRGHRPLGMTNPGTGFAVPIGVTLSTDRRYWWDGGAWQDAESAAPPSAHRSPDGRQWWDGAAWRPVPPSAPPS